MKKNPRKDPTFEDFLSICKEADRLLTQIRKFPEAQGRKPSNLRAALIHHIAGKRGINITLNNLYLIYGKTNLSIIKQKKLITQILDRMGS
jgi:hypothetical protein